MRDDIYDEASKRAYRACQGPWEDGCYEHPHEAYDWCGGCLLRRVLERLMVEELRVGGWQPYRTDRPYGLWCGPVQGGPWWSLRAAYEQMKHEARSIREHEANQQASYR